MNQTTYISTTSEITELEALLNEIPKENVLERMGFEARLETARESIEGMKKQEFAKKAKLVFRGEPVSGSYGINAEFATKAVGKFVDAVTTIAASVADNLKNRGRVPDKQKNQLFITGTAIGSFGFEFEVPQVEKKDLFPEPSDVEKALNKVQELFQLTVNGSDDQVAEIVDEIHPRAVKKAADFLDYIATQEAWCGMEFKGNTFRFHGIEQLRQSAVRLQEDNIHESDAEFSGEFQGVLPASRTFEFKLQNGDIIRGKIGAGIEDADVLNRAYLHTEVDIQFHVIKVGDGKPRYSLLSLDYIEK